MPIITKIYLNAYDVKRPNLKTTHCERLYPARVIASFFSYWTTTRIFPGREPRNSSWTICILLCPQNLKNLERFWSILLIPDSKYLYGIRNYLQLPTPRNYLFMPDMNYLRKHSFRVRIYLYRVWNINTGSEIIHLSWQFRGFYSY